MVTGLSVITCVFPIFVAPPSSPYFIRHGGALTKRSRWRRWPAVGKNFDVFLLIQSNLLLGVKIVTFHSGSIPSACGVSKDELSSAGGNEGKPDEKYC